MCLTAWPHQVNSWKHASMWCTGMKTLRRQVIEIQGPDPAELCRRRACDVLRSPCDVPVQKEGCAVRCGATNQPTYRYNGYR